jgi:ribonucleoside-diphosphate reductase
MTFYDEETAIEESTKYFDEDSLAGKTWVNKYALTDEKGRFLESNPEQMHDRIIKEVMRIEKKYSNPQLTEDKLKEMMYHFKYIVLGGSGMSGIGNDYKYSSLSNCFVIESPTDSYGGICKSDQELLQLMKRRGGVGMDLSKLRPKGTAVTNDAKTSSGAVSFMERFSNSTREVSQNGRRGALMLSLEVTHPDAELFIDSKLDTSKITGANVSVKVTDKFMDAVKSGRKFLQKFPIDTPDEDLSIDPNKEYKEDQLYNGGKEGTYFKFVDAKRIWDKIIKNAWASAEPGVMFFDNMLKESPADIYDGYQTVSTNPCLSGDSKILMADGSRKKISEIVKGDEVISFDMDTCTPVKTKVVKSLKTKSNAEVISLGDLRLTPDHKVACPVSNEYKEAKDVRFVRTMESKSSMVLRNGENYDVNVGKGFLSSLGVKVELSNPVTGEFNIVVFGNKYFYSENLVEFKLLNYLLTHYPGKVEQNPDPIDGEKHRFKVDSLYFNVIKKRKKLHVSIKDTGGNMSPENLKILVDVIESLEYSFFTKEEVEDCMILRMQAPCGAYNIDEVYPRKVEEREDVYDIQLNVIHNFFAEGILVHNCGKLILLTIEEIL